METRTIVKKVTKSLDVNLSLLTDSVKQTDDFYGPALDALNKLNAIKSESKKIVSDSLTKLDRLVGFLGKDEADFTKRVRDLGIDISSIPQPKQYADRINRANSLAEKLRAELKSI